MDGGEPTFVLGAGCQKGGTSWLYDFLARSPEFGRGFAKEAMIFDVLDVPEHTWQRGRTFEAAARDLAQLGRGEAADARALHRAAMIADPAIYYDYFTALATRPGHRFSMDLTPNYALLSADRFREIRDEFAARGVRTRVVMLLRDPVERIWSQVRMHLRQRNRFRPDQPHRLSEAEIVLDRYQRETIRLRTRYELTLARLDEVFESSEVHVDLYERLFTSESTDRICAFVGIDAHAPDFEHRVNSSPREKADLPDEVVATVARYYADTYAAVAARPGLEDVARLWPSARFVLD